MEKYGKARQATDDYIRRFMRTACCRTKDTNTHPEHVILIASPQQQWLPEHASMLRLGVHYLYFFNIMSQYPCVIQNLVPLVGNRTMTPRFSNPQHKTL